MDFIRRINDFSEVRFQTQNSSSFSFHQVILRIARQFERQIPVEKRVKTSYAQRYKIRLQAAGGGIRRRSLVPIEKVDSNSSLANIAENGIPHSASYTGLFNSQVLQSARQRTGRGSRQMARQMSREEIAELSGQSMGEQYREVLRELQMCTWKWAFHLKRFKIFLLHQVDK